MLMRCERAERQMQVVVLEHSQKFFLGGCEAELRQQLRSGKAEFCFGMFEQRGSGLDSSGRVVEGNRPKREITLFRILALECRGASQFVFEIEQEFFNHLVDNARADRIPHVAKPNVEGANSSAEADKVLIEDQPQHPAKRLRMRRVNGLENSLAQSFLALCGEQEFLDEFPAVRPRCA